MDFTNIEKLLKNKRVLVLAGGIVLIVLLIVIFLPAPPKQKEDSGSSVRNVQRASPQKQTSATPQTQFLPTPTISAELQIAIDEAKKSAQEYDDRQANLRINYPWLRKLPLAGEKYFVYFDLNKESFIGRLYPTAGDNVVQMKADIMRQLKEDKGIPMESYNFQWMVSPR